MVFREDWTKKVGKVFNTRPRIGSSTDAVWLERTHTSQRFAEIFSRPGAHVCLDGPSGAGKTSLALTHLFGKGIKHSAVQLTENMDWIGFCRQILDSVTNEETALTGDIEVGIDKIMPVAKLRVTLGSKHRREDALTYIETLARGMTEHDVARRLCELNAALYVDDVERANDQLLGRLSDLCKILTQGYVADNAKVVFVGSGEVYQRLYRRNPSLDERLLQVSLGAFKESTDSWKFLTKGFEKLRLRHPGNSEFLNQRDSIRACIDAIWEAADGLPKSLNRLGQEIALKAQGRKAVSGSNIITEANRMSEEHWIEYGRTFSSVIDFLEQKPAAISVLRGFYERGIARIHQFKDIAAYVDTDGTKGGTCYTQVEIENAIEGLMKLDFLVRTGKSGEIIFTKHPSAAHTLGVAIRNPLRFKWLGTPVSNRRIIELAFPVQQELRFATSEGAPSY